MKIIDGFKKELEEEREDNRHLRFQLKNNSVYQKNLTKQLDMFNNKRQKDQEIIDKLVSQRDDLKFLVSYLEEEMVELKKKDWLLQQSKIENELLKKDMSTLREEMNLLRSELNIIKKDKRKLKSRAVM